MENNKKLGFGCMRLPMKNGAEVDYDEFKKMVDKFMKEGFNYFDTAHGYIDGKSEIAIKECLVKQIMIIQALKAIRFIKYVKNIISL